MEHVDGINNPQISEVNGKLEAIHKDIKRLMEKSNQEYLELMLNNLKKDFINSILSYVKDDTEISLEREMINSCNMRETCKSTFTEFLTSNADLIHHDNLTNDTINGKKSELDKIREKAPYDKCDICFSEVESLFKKQLTLISSNKIYNNNKGKKPEISTIKEDILVKNVLEPLSNKQRLQILKSLSYETLTFTALSELTGLRGGNLLFHIQKLLESNLILQRHERGDYMITKKGFNLLTLLTDFQMVIEED